MKKSLEKSLKLEIKPLFQFSKSESSRQNFSDPITTTTVTATSVIQKFDVR